MDLNMEIVKPSSADELKPCPFCGSKEIVYGKYHNEDGERWMVGCLSCIATIAPSYAQTRFRVQEIWNRRFDFVTGRRI